MEVQTIRGITTRIWGGGRPFYGWAVVAAAALTTFSSGPGQTYVFSVFIDPIIAETGFSRTTVSGLYTVATGVSAAMAAIVSRMVDRFGPRLVLAAIALALGAACLGMSLAQGMLAFLLGFIAVRSLGQGSLPVTAMLLTAQWFVRRRGRAVSMVVLGFAASNAILPPLVRWLITSFGWRNAYVALGLLIWALLLPVALLVVRDSPESIGLRPDGIAPKASDGDTQAAESGAAAAAEQPQRRVLRARNFWLLALPLAAGPFTITALVFHQVSIFAEHGLSANVAAGVFAGFAAASAVMTTTAGFLIERLGPKRLLLLNLGVLVLALIELQFIATPLGATVYAITLGCVAGVHGVTGGVVWAHYYGRRGLGKIQGAASMVMISGAAVAPLPLAALHELFGNYSPGLAMLVAIPLGCALMLLTFREPPAHVEVHS